MTVKSLLVQVLKYLSYSMLTRFQEYGGRQEIGKKERMIGERRA